MLCSCSRASGSSAVRIVQANVPELQPRSRCEHQPTDPGGTQRLVHLSVNGAKKRQRKLFTHFWLKASQTGSVRVPCTGYKNRTGQLYCYNTVSKLKTHAPSKGNHRTIKRKCLDFRAHGSRTMIRRFEVSANFSSRRPRKRESTRRSSLTTWTTEEASWNCTVFQWVNKKNINFQVDVVYPFVCSSNWNLQVYEAGALDACVIVV